MDNWDEIQKQAQKVETERMKERLWSKRIFRIILLIGLLVFIAIGLYGYYYVTHALGPVDSKKTDLQEVTIPFDSTNATIAELLQEEGIINNADLFLLYLRFNNDKALQAGHYEFSPSMDAEQVLATLQDGGEPIFVDVDTTVTIVEGATIDQIAQVVEENTAITAEEFIDTLENPNFLESLQNKFPSLLAEPLATDNLKYRLEGYLYPATYDYIAGMSTEEFITQMVGLTNLNYHELQDDLVNTYLTYHEILTLASLIEREAITQEDRDLVSGVFYNRLAIDMPLQTDVSVLYALGEHREFVTFDDIEVESPYNTYTHVGLPPGPVNAPSYSAILAALYPTYSDYYYFVADIDTQEIFFSSTLEEHELLVEEYVNSKRDNQETTQETEETQEIIE